MQYSRLTVFLVAFGVVAPVLAAPLESKQWNDLVGVAVLTKLALSSRCPLSRFCAGCVVSNFPGSRGLRDSFSGTIAHGLKGSIFFVALPLILD
jgi:hypothetical protein